MTNKSKYKVYIGYINIMPYKNEIEIQFEISDKNNCVASGFDRIPLDRLDSTNKKDIEQYILNNIGIYIS